MATNGANRPDSGVEVISNALGMKFMEAGQPHEGIADFVRFATDDAKGFMLVRRVGGFSVLGIGMKGTMR